MTGNTFNLKTLAFSVALYLGLTVIASVVLTGIWQAGVDNSSMTHAQLTQLAAESEVIAVGSSLIGALAAVLCAAFATRRHSNSSYLPALMFALALILYGLLSIVLHPEHSLMQQTGKLLSPIPLCLVGAWLAMALSPARTHAPRS